MSTSCPNCGHDVSTPVPAEPAIGTWVKDRHGASHIRTPNGRWGSSTHDKVGFAVWDAMWEARGPLVECGPYGADLPA